MWKSRARGSGSRFTALHPVLRANSIRDCSAEGILILGPGSPWLSHNLLQGNQGANISARDGAKPVLLENQEVPAKPAERRPPARTRAEPEGKK